MLITTFFPYRHKKSADLRVAYSQQEAFALPTKSNKQQETYADMTLPHGIKPQRGTIRMYCTCSMKTSYQIGIYCYFAFDLVEKLRSFLAVKHKASINAINMYKPARI